MPVIDRAQKPRRLRRAPWIRADKLALAGVLMTLLASGIGVVTTSHGDPVTGAKGVTNNFGECLQFCTVSTAPSDGSDKPGPEEQGCRSDRNSPDFQGGYGPARNRLSDGQFSEYPAFDLKDSAERAFYNGNRMANDQPELPLNNMIEVRPGQSILLQIIVHNNTSSNNSQGGAKGTRVTVSLPNCTGRKIASTAYINALNTAPDEIWSNLVFVADQPFNLTYVEGSARVCSTPLRCPTLKSGGAPLSNALLSKGGATVGFDQLNGEIPGGGVVGVYFLVRPQFV